MLRALCAHTKATCKKYLLLKTLRVLSRPGRARRDLDVEDIARSEVQVEGREQVDQCADEVAAARAPAQKIWRGGLCKGGAVISTLRPTPLCFISCTRDRIWGDTVPVV